MMIQCKFRVTAVRDSGYGPGGSNVTLEAQYDPSIPDDMRFHQATPSGKLDMFVTNFEALKQLQEGQTFYLNLVPASA